jgi:RNA polymerase sigma factor (sigma-70 family)
MGKLTSEQQQQVVKLMPYVRRIVKARGMSGAQYEDSLSACHEALCKAVLSYDPDRGMSLKNWVANYARTALTNEQRFAHGLSTESTQDARVRTWAHNNIPDDASPEEQRALLKTHFPDASAVCISRVVWGRPDTHAEREQINDGNVPKVPSSLSEVMSKNFLQKWLAAIPEYSKRKKPIRKIVREHLIEGRPQKEIEGEYGISRTTMHKYITGARDAWAQLTAETRKGEKT